MLVEDRVAPGVDRCLMYALFVPHHVIDSIGEALNEGVAVGLEAADRAGQVVVGSCRPIQLLGSPCGDCDATVGRRLFPFPPGQVAWRFGDAANDGGYPLSEPSADDLRLKGCIFDCAAQDGRRRRPRRILGRAQLDRPTRRAWLQSDLPASGTRNRGLDASS